MEHAAHKTRRRRGTSALGRWAWAAVLSGGGHVLLFLLLAATGALKMLGHVTPAKVNAVSMRALPQNVWAQNRSVGPVPPKRDPSQKSASQQEPPKPEEKKKPEEMPKGRVVDVAPGNDEKPDDDARFLAEHNNRVKKETFSKDATPNYKNAMPKPSTTQKNDFNGGKDATEKPVIAGNDGKGQDERKATEGHAKSQMEIPSVQKRDRLALKLDGRLGGDFKNQDESEEVKGNSQRLRIQAGQSPDGVEEEGSLGQQGSSALRTLTPSAAALDKLVGAPAADLGPDDDVEKGEGTYLNTKEWKYSSFFNRIKQSIGQHWDPNAVVRRRDPTGEMFLYKDRYTVVTVTLDQRGLLKNVFVNKGSGVEFLDEEAVAAFQRAQPFPNPPPGLTNERGEVNFAFGFYLEVSSRPSLKMFRLGN